jgi:hypothetical protein
MTYVSVHVSAGGIFVLQARELSELLDFAEQERLTLLEREAALQQELAQVRVAAGAAATVVMGASEDHRLPPISMALAHSGLLCVGTRSECMVEIKCVLIALQVRARAETAEAAAADAAAGAAELDQQLAATKQEVRGLWLKVGFLAAAFWCLVLHLVLHMV